MKLDAYKYYEIRVDFQSERDTHIEEGMRLNFGGNDYYVSSVRDTGEVNEYDQPIIVMSLEALK